MAHSDGQKRKWKGNWPMEWVASTLHTTTEHGVSSITTADVHTSAASSRLKWSLSRFKWIRPFRRKNNNGFCAAWMVNKVRELATVCLPWQHWTKALVWFDDVDISAFRSYVVDLWQSLSEWHLLMSACGLVCRRENVGAWIRATNEH